MKFLIIKKKSLIYFVLLFLAIFCIASAFVTISANVPSTKFTIVIDAGHGGGDVKLGQQVFKILIEKDTYFISVKKKAYRLICFSLFPYHKLSFLQKISCGYIIP